jgi:uncharacterized protein YbbC (DUF1343 family)
VVDRRNHSNRYKLTAIFGRNTATAPTCRTTCRDPPRQDRRRSCRSLLLYSETREPTKEILDLIDVLVIDPGTSARIYTFIYTTGQLPARNFSSWAPGHRVRPSPIGGTQSGRSDAGADLSLSSAQFACPCATA